MGSARGVLGLHLLDIILNGVLVEVEIQIHVPILWEGQEEGIHSHKK
jgi:hypothetical protein